MSKIKLLSIKITIDGKDANSNYTLEPEIPFTTFTEAIDYLKNNKDDFIEDDQSIPF